jgi:LmbE family N-acetylglucosaminyl deacetylase
MRVLAVGAHPDDLEILCAGTLARFSKRGDQVAMCYFTRGEKGHFTIPSDELADIRKDEALQAAKLIDAEVYGLGLLDGEVNAEDILTQRKIIDVIRQVRPDVIITHSPNDTYHSDHGRVSKLVLDASFHASVPKVKTDYEHHDLVPPIYYMEISDTFMTKLQMVSKHQSQLTWLKEHDNLYILDVVETIAKFRGWQCGVKYAEGFIPCLRWPRITTERFLP